jgi:hypothetical protein
VHGRAAGLHLERPLAAPLGQETGRDILEQNDLTGVGVVPHASEHSSRLRGVFDAPLSYVAQVQIGTRLDSDVVRLLDRLDSEGFQFEALLKLACCLCGDFPAVKGQDESPLFGGALDLRFALFQARLRKIVLIATKFRRAQDYCALPASSLRSILSPALLIPNCGWLSPESSCFGTNPQIRPHIPTLGESFRPLMPSIAASPPWATTCVE